MEVIRALELALALIALVSLPCAIAAMICADEAIDAFRVAIRRRRERWSEHRLLGKLDRTFAQPRQSFPQVGQLFALTGAGLARSDADPPSGWHAIPAALRSSASGLRRVLPGARPVPAVEPEFEAVRPPFEQIAEDLRRLRADLVSAGSRDEIWHGAIEHAYDVRLREACRALGIAEYLDELSGIDREIEQIRIEGELIAAGMRIR